MKSAITDIEYLSKTRQTYANTLSFAGKGLKLNTREETLELATAIANTNPLKCLRLEGNTISPVAAEELAKALVKHPELERFIGNDIFTGRLKDEIPLALHSMCGSLNTAGTHLVEINMSDNAFGPIGLDALVAFFASPCCYSLKEIRMHNNGLGPEGSRKFAQALEKCHENSGGALALRVFVCGRNRLELEGSRHVSRMLKAMGTLEEIQMPQNGIRTNGIEFLAEACAANVKLRIINFNDNTFLNKGSEQIAQAIATLDDLEYVNLGDCLLRSKGAKMVARSLVNLAKLKEAILSFNEIDLTSGLEIANLFRNNQKLELLDLNGNHFGEEGKMEILKILEPITQRNALASLSEDEGSDEEEEEEGEEGDEEEEDDDVEYEEGEYDEEDDYEDEDEEGDDEDQEGEDNDQYDIIEQKDLQEVVADTINPFSKIVATNDALMTSIDKLDKYFLSPNIETLKAIDDESLNSLSKHSKFNTSFLLRFAANMAKLYDANNSNDASAIMNIAMNLVGKHLATSENVNMFCDEFLTEFGLLKNEDKKFRPIEINDKLLCLLENIAKQESFPKLVKDKIVDFLKIRNSNLNESNTTQRTLKTRSESFIKCFS